MAVAPELVVIAYGCVLAVLLYALAVGYRYRDKRGAIGFLVTGSGIAIHTAARTVELLVGMMYPEAAVLFAPYSLITLGGAVGAVGWLLFAVEYTNYRTADRSLLTALFCYPVAAQFFVWTSPIHGYGIDIAASTVQQGVLTVSTESLLWYGPPVLNLALLLVGSGLLVADAVTSSGLRRTQSLLLSPIVLPTVAALCLSWLLSIPYDLAPFGFLLSAGGFLLAIVRMDVFELVPVARETALEKMPDGVVTLDVDGDVVDVNDETERLLTVEEEAVIGLSAETFFDRHLGTEYDPDVLADGGLELVVDQEGRKRHVAVSSSPVATTTGETAGRIVVIREITDRKQRERELEVLRQVLSRVLRHNLRNDLQVIRMTAELIPDAPEEDVEDLVADIVRTSDDLAETGHKARRIERVLDSHGNVRPVDVSTIVSEVVEEIMAERPGASISVDTPETAIARSHVELRLAIEDLVENALIHAKRPDPDVSVHVEREPSWIRVDVVDDGPGIPDDELRVLDQQRETPLEHSSGAGLWLVTLVVEESGGTLEFDSSQDGTTVTLRLPRVDSPESSGQASDPPTDEEATDHEIDHATGRRSVDGRPTGATSGGSEIFTAPASETDHPPPATDHSS